MKESTQQADRALRQLLEATESKQSQGVEGLKGWKPRDAPTIQNRLLHRRCSLLDNSICMILHVFSISFCNIFNLQDFAVSWMKSGGPLNLPTRRCGFISPTA